MGFWNPPHTEWWLLRGQKRQGDPTIGRLPPILPVTTMHPLTHLSPPLCLVLMCAVPTKSRVTLIYTILILSGEVSWSL